MTFRSTRFIAAGVLLVALAGCSGTAAPSAASTLPAGSAAASSAASIPAATTSVPTAAPASLGPGGTAPIDPLFATHSDPGLEAQLPKQVGGVALTTYSLTLDELIAAGNSDPASVNVFLQGLGKTTADASFAGAFDPTSTLTGGIQAYKVAGADPAALLTGITNLSKSDVGITAAVHQATVGGKSVTVVSIGNGPNDTQWLYGRGDVVFTVLAADEATAAPYLQALP